MKIFKELIETSKELQNIRVLMEIKTEEMINMIDRAYINEHLTIGLINKQINHQYLKVILYKDFLDLAVIVKLELVSDDGEYIGSMNINKDCLEIWGMTFDDVYSQAWSNFMKEQTVIMTMEDTIGPAEDCDFDLPMYIFTNKKMIHGAARILDSDMLLAFANDINCDLVVIPSSIHECIIVPFENVFELNGLSEMIRDINSTDVRENEILSDHPYVFRRNGGWDF